MAGGTAVSMRMRSTAFSSPWGAPSVLDLDEGDAVCAPEGASSAVAPRHPPWQRGSLSPVQGARPGQGVKNALTLRGNTL